MTELSPTTSGPRGDVAIARHGKLPKRRPWGTVLSAIAAALAVVLLSGGIVAALVVIQTPPPKIETLPGEETEGPVPGIGAYQGGFNMLIVGSDRCESSGGCGVEREGDRNDVTMLLHVSADGTHATAVSFPRDLVIPIPECPGDNGSTYPAVTGAINSSLGRGGLSCTVLTVEQLTGLDIQFAGLITFKGVIRMSNAVGGVEVCVASDIDDPYVGLHLDKGKHTLKGADALAFLRSRHGVGTGSDLTRISSQQVYLTSLVRTLKSSDTLSNPVKIYSLGRAALKSMTLSRGLSQLDTMASIALRLKDVPLENVTFVQYPSVDGVGVNLNRVVPSGAKAEQLFATIRADKPFKLKKVGDDQGAIKDPDAPKPSSTPAPSGSSTGKPSASPSATSKPVEKETLDVTGTTAADYTCSVAN